MSRLSQLQECGQSYWLDNLTRGMLRNGELQRRIREEGLVGVTANPSTFGTALASGDYDGDIRRLVGLLGHDPRFPRLHQGNLRLRTPRSQIRSHIWQ